MHISLGTEAAAQLKLDRFNKETTVAQNKRAIQLLREAGTCESAHDCCYPLRSPHTPYLFDCLPRYFLLECWKKNCDGARETREQNKQLREEPRGYWQHSSTGMRAPISFFLASSNAALMLGWCVKSAHSATARLPRALLRTCNIPLDPSRPRPAPLELTETFRGLDPRGAAGMSGARNTYLRCLARSFDDPVAQRVMSEYDAFATSLVRVEFPEWFYTAVAVAGLVPLVKVPLTPEQASQGQDVV